MGILWSKPAASPSDVSIHSPYGHTRDDSAGLPLEREPSPAADGQMQWQPDQQAVWVADAAFRECMLCKTAFSWLTRRHHCRQCGSLVCQDCSPHRAMARGYMTPQRVCAGCMGALLMAEQSAAASRRESAERDSRSRRGSSAIKRAGGRSGIGSAASSRQSSRRSSRRTSPVAGRLVVERQIAAESAATKQTEERQQQQQSASILSPVPVHGATQATVLLLHGESASSVKATSSGSDTATITTNLLSSGLPPMHTPRSSSSRPASPTTTLPSGQACPAHYSTLSLSVGGAVASTASTVVDSPSAAAGATSIRRPSLTAGSREHSPSHSPRRRKSISGSPAFQPQAPTPVTASAAVPASFVVESLPPLVLFNRLAGFGSLLVLDVRSSEHYRAGHVPRALNLPMSDGDLLSPEDAQRPLEPAQCTAMLSSLEQRLHLTDQRAFRMRQRCTVVIVGQPADESSATAAASDSSIAAADSSTITASSAPYSSTPRLSSSHSPLCLHLSRLLLLEGKVSAVSVLDGGFPAFLLGYPFVSCAYTALESRSGKHIHKKPFPWYPNEIMQDQLFLGSKVDAANLDHLKQIRVRAVLNCTAEIPNHFEEEEEEEGEEGAAEPASVADGGARRRLRFSYKRIELHDEVTVSISSCFTEAFAFLDSARAAGTRVLVHCQEGISRSSTIVIAYLMSRHGLSLHAAYQWVKSQRKQIFPNLGFWRQLDLFERTLVRERMVAEAEGRGEDAAATVPPVEQISGTMDQCIDLALLTSEYRARKAAAEGRAAELQAEAVASPSSSSLADVDDASLTPSQRVHRAVLSPVGRGGTLMQVKGVASDDAKTRAEEAVVEEAQTPCGPIVTSG